jgi:hypothetical protein
VFFGFLVGVSRALSAFSLRGPGTKKSGKHTMLAAFSVLHVRW